MPSVIILGDSISVYYTPFVRDLLAGKDLVIDQFAAGDSAQLLAGLPEWVGTRQPDLIQFNCGLHDARYYRQTKLYQQPLANYAANLQQALQWLKTNTSARLLWATTTPVITERITLEYVRFPADIVAYNAVAKEIMDTAAIPINDLHAVLSADSPADCISGDGVHMTESGNLALARAVAAGIVAALERT